MSVFDRLFGKARETATAARRAELEGDLPRAAKLWAEASRPDEAARVMLLRGDAELDSGKRLQLYVQAVSLAPEGHLVRDLARKKRALLALGIAREGATSAAARLDLQQAGKELEALGEAGHAAEAYALAGDVDGETRALVEGGEIERLEEVLDRDHDRARTERKRHGAHADIEQLLGSGQRREALARAEALAAASGEDAAATDRVRMILSRRATGPRVTIERRGKQMGLLIGEEVLIGRSEGAIQIVSQAVSRRHLVIARVGAGVEVRDLGGRNGTELRGMRIAGSLPVSMEKGAVLELKLGGEVPLRLAPSDAVDGALEIHIGGAHYVAPLGTARLGVGAWTLETGADGWLELVTGDAPFAYLGDMRLGPRTALLAGDAISDLPGAGSAIALRVL